MKYRALILSILFLFAGVLANAQSHNEQVTVEGSYRPQIKRSERMQKMPETPENKFNIPDYKVEAKDFDYGYDMEVETMSAMTYKADYVADDKENFLKAGLGTRLSPLFLFRHYSELSRTMSIGVGINHYSSWLNNQDYKKSSFMNNDFNVMAVNKLNGGQLSSFIDYKYDMYHLRAYEGENSNGRNIHSVNLGAKWIANGSSYRDLYTEIGGDYRATWIAGGTTEHQLNAKAHLAYTNDYTIAADAEINYNNNYQGQLLVALNPYLNFGGDFFRIHAGLRLDFKTGGNVGLYPDVKGSLYIFDKKVEFYAKFGGCSKINTFADIIADNPFVTTNFTNFSDFGYEKTSFDFQGGVKAKITDNVDAHVGVRYRNMKNSVYFVPDRNFYVTYGDDARVYHLQAFDIVFQDCDHTSFIADVHWKAMEKLDVSGEFVYNINNIHEPDLKLTQESSCYYGKPWYRPTYTITLRGDYQFNETWKFNAAMMILGKCWAMNLDGNAEQLKPALDIQLGADYKIREDLAAFVEIHNLFHDKYQLYYNYPSLGFEVFAGIKYRF